MFDTTIANTRYYNRILEHCGRPDMTPDQQTYVHMHTVDEALAYLFPGDALLESAQQYRRRMGYLPFIRHMTMEPDLKPVLMELRSRYHTAIATNRMDTMQRVLVEHGLEGWFDLVVTARDVPFPKPHPHQLIKILTHFEIHPDQAVFVGDSELDAMAAASARVPFVAYKNQGLNADLHVAGFRALGAILFSADGGRLR